MPASGHVSHDSRRWLMLSALIMLPAGPLAGADLFRDDFSRFPDGWLTSPIGQMNAAIQEYHHLAHRGVPLGPWANASCHQDAWLAGEEDGKPYLEQALSGNQPQWTNPIFLTGDPEWSDYAGEVKVSPLSASEFAGVVFKYHTNRHYYLFALHGGAQARLAVRQPIEKVFRVPEWRELATPEFPYTPGSYYTLHAGPLIRALVNR